MCGLFCINDQGFWWNCVQNLTFLVVEVDLKHKIGVDNLNLVCGLLSLDEIEDHGQATVRNHKITDAEGAIKEQNIRGSAEDVLFL